MTWDYYIATGDEVKKKVEEYDSKLSRLEDQLKQRRGKERQEIQARIKQVIENFRNSYEREVNEVEDEAVSRTLATLLVDNTSVWWFSEFPRKEDARAEIYMPIARLLSISKPSKVCDGVDFRPDFGSLPSQDWLAFQVDFELLTPWYSKDDRVFHVMDNPVRKDRVFGVPFMAASSCKGMLRWACRMQAGLREHLEQHNGTLDGWRDPDWILHLFGNEKGEGEEFNRGALVLYPTWFDKIGFEVINPHSRERRAGTQPIYYEVVPPGAKGTFYLLYAPWPGMKPKAEPTKFLPKLLEAIETLLTTYGISAKRTVSWGTAKIEKWHAFRKTGGTVEKDSCNELWQEVQTWISGGGAP